MKKIISLFITAFAIIASLGSITAPVYADGECPEGCVPTAILGENHCSCDDGNGSGVMHILNTVIDIMTIGIGILGVIGISVVGIQYLTAGGSEEKTRKAKRRMFEIVIGLVAYVILYAVVKWLMPTQ
ncbi:hypothetical protein IKG38_00605 [Candidatus Saccharibacteria bacterium]|nr:hypothetical protein [Candidatus Saccharibacteria bacterium]